MVLFEKFRCLWRSLGIYGHRAENRGRARRGLYLPQELEARVLLSTMTLSGTPGNDTITFQQTDATHDTFTLNGTPNTFSTVGVTAITINSGAGTDSISVLSDNSGIPLLVTGSGADTVTIGNASNGVQGILGAITLSGTTGLITLTADDSANSTFINTATISSTEISGLAPATIDYTSGQLGSISIKGGSDGAPVEPDTFDVTSTDPGTPVTIAGGLNGVGGVARSMLIGPNLYETWNLTGPNAGSVSNITFTNIPEVQGGSGDDTFDLPKNTFFGNIDGGAGNNTLVSPTGVADSWDIYSTNSGSNNEADFANIENLIGANVTTGTNAFYFSSGSITGTINGGGGNASIQANNTSATITGVNSGTIEGSAFTNIPVILGVSDTFTFGTAGVITSITGLGSNNTVVGANLTNAWNITGANAGTINGINPFTGIQNFVGGTGSDTFTFDTSASVTGSVNGGGGNDTLLAPNFANNWVISGANAGTLNGMSFSNIGTLTGGTAADQFAFGSSGSLSGSIYGGGGTNTILGGNVANTWNMTSGNAGTFDGTTFSNIQDLIGGSVSDDFAFNPSGFVSGTVTGGGGTETLDYSSRSVGVAVNLQTNTATAVGGGVSGITGLTGGTGANTLTGANATTSWDITGANAGALNSTFYYTGIQTLIAGTGNDTFVFLNGGSVSSPINGGGGTNTLVTEISNNIWDITGSNSGTLNGSAFINIQNLTGGPGSDSYVFSPSGVLSGNIDGTASAAETLNYEGLSTAVAVNLQTGAHPATFSGTATAINGGFTNFNTTTLIGGTGSNTLTGANIQNTWNIYAPNSGVLDGACAFIGIQNLVGGPVNDSFVFGSSGVESGTINGSGGINTLDYSARSVGVSVNLQSGTVTCIGGGVTNIENVVGTPGNDHIVAATSGSVITGGGGNDTLIGGPGNDTFILASNQGGGTYVNGVSGNDMLVAPNISNTWDIIGPNTGTLNGATFANIENMTGGSGNNTFAFGPSGVVSGTINGGGGTDTLDYSSRSAGVLVNLQAGSAPAIGGGFTNINSLIGGSGFNTLTGPNSANTWNITGANTGNVNGTFSFSGIQNLTGGTVTNSFAFASGGSVSGLIRGGGGIGTLDYSALSTGIVVDLINGIAADIGGVAGVQNVISSTGNDTITAHPLGSVITASGNGTDTLIGGPGNDTFILSATQGAGTTVDGRGGSNTLVGPNVANTWDITSGNTGTLNGAAFNNIQNLNGGTANDTFAFGPSGFVSGAVNGGSVQLLSGSISNFVPGSIIGGGAINTLDYSSRSAGVLVNLQADSATAIGGGFTNINSLIGGTGSNTLTGANTANTWNITGANTGNVNGTFSFSEIQNLTGGTATNSFAFAGGGSVSGLIRGGGGIGTLDYSALSTGIVVDLSNGIAPDTGGVSGVQNVIGSTGNDTITANPLGSVITASGSGTDTLIGGPGNDTFILSGTQGAGTTVDGRGGSNTLVGPNVANTWDITSGNTGTLNGIAFHNVQNLTGGTVSDSFVLEPSGFVSGAVTGGGGTETLDYSSRNSGVVANLQTGVATAIGGGVTNVQNVIGTSDNDQITGSAAGGVITANGGNDTLIGGTGNSTFILSSNQGSSTYINGQGGIDTLVGPNITSTWNITGSNTGTVNGIAFINIQNLTGGTGLNYFDMGVNGSLTGILNGGSPTGNWLDYSAWTTNTSSVNLATGTATNIGSVTNLQNVRAAQQGGSLTGNSVGNILIGGQYDATAIQGGSGRSLLISNSYSYNTIHGGSGNDIIIGLHTTFDASSLANNIALASILAEWQSSDSYSTRIAYINGTTPGGLNGTNYLIFGTTVITNAGIATMTGAAGGMNWYFAGIHDVITNLQNGEQVN